MREFIVKETNHRVRYHDLAGEGMPILFLHGLGCAGSFDYPEVAAHPSLAGHRRILVDLLGSGFSDHPLDANYKVEDHVNYLLQLIEALELNRFILFGHSLGGAVALSLAARCRDKVHNLILSESNLDAGGGFSSKAIAAYSEADFTDHGFQKVLDGARRSSNEMWAASLALTLPKAAHQLSCSAVEGVSPSWREILCSMTCPRTFIYGEKSLPDPDTEALAKQGIHIEIVKHAGHSMAWENPEGLALAICEGISQGN